MRGTVEICGTDAYQGEAAMCCQVALRIWTPGWS
jgi:hypothetical protein